jgi:hypothetical protein
LDVEQQLTLYRSITRAITALVAEREAWVEYVEKSGECYCKNPLRAHIANADDWAACHIHCASRWLKPTLPIGGDT